MEKKCGSYLTGYCWTGNKYFVCTGKKHVVVIYDSDNDKIVETQIIDDCDEIRCKTLVPFTPKHIIKAAINA